MYENIKKLIQQTGLTADQIIYLMSLHNKDDLVATYPKPFFQRDIKDLIDKGYIVGCYTKIRNNIITPQGSALLFVDEDEAAKEIWDLYPDYFDKYQTKSMNKELFILKYMQKTGNSRQRHEYIKNLLEVAIHNGWINRKLENWLVSEQWEEWDRLVEQTKQMKGINDSEFV